MRPLLLLIGTGAAAAAAALSLILLMLMLILWQWCGGAGAHVGADVDSARINLSIHRQTICCSLSSLEYLSRAEYDEWSYAGKRQEQLEAQQPMHNEK